VTGFPQIHAMKRVSHKEIEIEAADLPPEVAPSHVNGQTYQACAAWVAKKVRINPLQ
jgi:hypothetical protein